MRLILSNSNCFGRKRSRRMLLPLFFPPYSVFRRFYCLRKTKGMAKSPAYEKLYRKVIGGDNRSRRWWELPGEFRAREQYMGRNNRKRMTRMLARQNKGVAPEHNCLKDAKTLNSYSSQEIPTGLYSSRHVFPDPISNYIPW